MVCVFGVGGGGVCLCLTNALWPRSKPRAWAPEFSQSRQQPVKVWKAHLKGIRCCTFSLCAINVKIWFLQILSFGLPWWLSGKETSCHCRSYRFNPWSGTIPHAERPLSLCTTTVEPALQSPGTATTEPMCHYRSPHALEPVFCNKSRHCNVKPMHHNQRVFSTLVATREKPAQQGRSSIAKNE